MYLSVRLSQAGIVVKPLDESSWFWHGGCVPAIPHCIVRKFGYLQNKGASLWNFVPNAGLRKFCHRSWWCSLMTRSSALSVRILSAVETNCTTNPYRCLQQTWPSTMLTMSFVRQHDRLAVSKSRVRKGSVLIFGDTQMQKEKSLHADNHSSSCFYAIRVCDGQTDGQRDARRRTDRPCHIFAFSACDEAQNLQVFISIAAPPTLHFVPVKLR